MHYFLGEKIQIIKKKQFYKVSVFLFLIISGCTGIPDGITPVNNFNLDFYLGTWYEVARLDNRLGGNVAGNSSL